MPLVARASKTVKLKNIFIILLCLGFFAPFAYDAFVGYPRTDDLAVEHWKEMLDKGQLRPTDAQRDIWTSALNSWPKWNNAGNDERRQMNEIHDEVKKVTGGDVKWLSPFDVALQRWIVYGLGAAVLASIWWLFHCQKRRAIADENTISPAPGIIIPWDQITIVDNTRWKKSGIVDITYLDGAGKTQKAKFDDYELDREPLLEILDQLAEKARKADFIPREEPPIDAQSP